MVAGGWEARNNFTVNKTRKRINLKDIKDNVSSIEPWKFLWLTLYSLLVSLMFYLNYFNIMVYYIAKDYMSAEAFSAHCRTHPGALILTTCNAGAVQMRVIAITHT